MTERSLDFQPFDPVDYLDSDESIEAFLLDALESGAPLEIADALGVIARAKGLTSQAMAAGLDHRFLERLPATAEAPSWPVLFDIIASLGLQLTPVTIKPAA